MIRRLCAALRVCLRVRRGSETDCPRRNKSPNAVQRSYLFLVCASRLREIDTTGEPHSKVNLVSPGRKNEGVPRTIPVFIKRQSRTVLAYLADRELITLKSLSEGDFVLFRSNCRMILCYSRSYPISHPLFCNSTRSCIHTNETSGRSVRQSTRGLRVLHAALLRTGYQTPPQRAGRENSTNTPCSRLENTWEATLCATVDTM